MTGGGESDAARRPRRRFKLGACLGLFLALALAPATASAADWSVTQLSQNSTQAAFYATSCPSPSFCAAVGGNGTIAVSANPTGGASAWRVGRPAGSFEAPAEGVPPGAETS